MNNRKIENNILDREDVLKQNAMILYPYIHDTIISHGKAAELLGIYKLDLIVLYGKLGISYFQESAEEIASDLQSIKKYRLDLKV